MSLAVEVRTVPRSRLEEAAAEQLISGARLAAVVCRSAAAGGFVVRYVFVPRSAADGPAVELTVDVPSSDPTVPSLAARCFPAGQFEREMADLFGVRATGHPQPKRLVSHAHWPTGWAPMRGTDLPAFGPDVDGFPFAEVDGPGVSQIAVGPVHAGIIEPGHFRFSVIGETIVRMEPRFWFLHRGVEKVFEGRTPREGLSLAEHVTGDTPVGHGLAFALAVEAALGLSVPDDTQRRRALLLELERLINHVTDLGALANDAGFAIGNVHALRLRERLNRINALVTGHRLLRGALRIGGVEVRTLPDPAVMADLAAELAGLVSLVQSHGIVRDRLAGTAVLAGLEAEALGALGFVARASGVDVDVRRDLPFVPLPGVFAVCVEAGGDVLARFRVRAREAEVSAAVVVALTNSLATTGVASEAGPAAPRSPQEALPWGVGLIEAWRGALLHHVELRPDGRLMRVKIVDPSFFNWPTVPLALRETIVPDFPLTNKSFNQSYAGNDL